MRLALVSAFSLVGLFVGYFFVFCFYASGLFGDGSHVTASQWEKALRGTMLLGPFVGGFLLLAFLAWRERWSTGVLPFMVDFVSVLLLARKGAGILVPSDAIWAGFLIVMSAVVKRSKGDDEEDRS